MRFPSDLVLLRDLMVLGSQQGTGGRKRKEAHTAWASLQCCCRSPWLKIDLGDACVRPVAHLSTSSGKAVPLPMVVDGSEAMGAMELQGWLRLLWLRSRLHGCCRDAPQPHSAVRAAGDACISRRCSCHPLHPSCKEATRGVVKPRSHAVCNAFNSCP